MIDLEILALADVDDTNLQSVEAFERLVAYYETMNSSLGKDKEAAKSSDNEGNPVKDAFRLEVANDEEVAEACKNVVADIRSALAALMDEHPYSSILLVDMLKTLASEMVAERNYQETLALKEVDVPKLEVSLPDDWHERKALAEKMQEQIKMVWTIVSYKIVGKATSVKYKEGIKDGKPSGKYLPSLSKITQDPKDDDNSSSLVGRAATNARIVYEWNGEVLPTSMMNVILHDYISDFVSGYVVTWGDLRDKVKEAGFASYAKAAEKGASIEFDTGTLTMSMQEK
jgi:hypothetical protein